MEDQVLLPKNYQINQGFRYVEDYLYCEDIRVCDLLSSKMSDQFVTTPLYVYSKKQIEVNIAKYKTAMSGAQCDIQLSYSVKANMNPAILKLMMNHGLYLTLVSGHELRLALELGQDPAKIILNGNGKMDWEVDLACKRGALVNVDSAFNLTQTIRICQEGGYVAKVLFRVNPDINPDVHGYVSTGQEGSKFGISEKELDEVLEMAIKSERIRVVGLHCHIGSTLTDSEKFRQSTQALVDLYQKIQNQFPEMHILNLGGGLSIPYKAQITLSEEIKLWLQLKLDKYKDQRHAELYETLIMNRQEISITVKKLEDVDNNETRFAYLTQLQHAKITLATFLDSIITLPHGKEICRKLQEQLLSKVLIPEPEDLVKSVCDILPPRTMAILEPGRSLVGNSAILLSRVLGTKSSGNKNYIVLDGSMTEVIRPCLYGAYHHIALAEPSRISSHVSTTNQSTFVFDVVGPVCESADFLGKDRQLAPPHTGCLMAVFDTGAYCSSMSSNYNMRVRPAELLVDGDKATVIRQSETFENMMYCYMCCFQRSENTS